MRRTVEDRLAGAIKGSQPSYSVLSDDQSATRTGPGLRFGTEASMAWSCCSWSASTSHPPTSRGRPTWCPQGYRSMYGGGLRRLRGYGTVYDPGYVREDQLVNFDTNIYRVADEKLLWAGRSQTSNPKEVNRND